MQHTWNVLFSGFIRMYVYTCIYIYMHTYITFHCIALLYISSHYITLHYITLHYIHIRTAAGPNALPIWSVKVQGPRRAVHSALRLQDRLRRRPQLRLRSGPCGDTRFARRDPCGASSAHEAFFIWNAVGLSCSYPLQQSHMADVSDRWTRFGFKAPKASLSFQLPLAPFAI